MKKPFDPDSVYYSVPDNSPKTTFFFYDLETSGLDSRTARIMQFAGQRTDLNFKPIGDPVNLLVKLSDDTLPSPGAIAVTKITPQSTQLDGLTEAEFCKYVSEEIFTPGTIEMGYNSVRFDDEFMRHIFWRCFYDPYEWQWKDGRSKWDLLDVVRLTRALRPEGIEWPVKETPAKDAPAKNASSKNTPARLSATNRLELLTKCNNIEHKHAHDALSDVEALISVTKLIHDKQPELYNYLFSMRGKNEIKKLVNLDKKTPFVYSSGRYSSEFNNTTVAFPLAPGRNGNVLVFDLRFNLEELLRAEAEYVPEERTGRDGKKYLSQWSWFPIVKELAFNHCPVVAPVGVLEAKSETDSTDAAHPMKKGSTGWEKIGLDKDAVNTNLKILLSHPEFAERMRDLHESRPEFPPAVDPESALYDSFLSNEDARLCSDVRRRDANELADFHPNFSDERLGDLLLHYKAKNFPSSLTESEHIKWERYRTARLARSEQGFIAELSKLEKSGSVEPSILEDLMLWYQSLGNDYA